MFTNGNGLSQPVSGNGQGRTENLSAGQYHAYSQQSTMGGLQTMPSQPSWSPQQDSKIQRLYLHI